MPSESDQLIERPARWISARIASKIIGLSLEEVKALHDAIPDAAEIYLHTNLSWKWQSAEGIAAFFKGIVETLPFLQRYKNAWPAEGCMREYLSRHKQRTCKAQNKLRPKPVSHRALPCANNSKAAQVAAPEKELQTPQRPAPAASPPVVRSETPKGEAAVRAFLQSTRPAMDRLTPIFVHYGVADYTHLRVLAELPEQEQSEFLRHDLNLNAWQALIIGLALRSM